MTYLDISSEISPEEYRKVLSSFLEQFEQWRISRGWCSDLYKFVAPLTGTFRWNPYGRLDSLYRDGYTGCMELDIPEDRTPAQMAADLRELRGRVLRYTLDRNEYLSLEKANEFLTTAGLAPWTPEAPAVPNRYRVSVDARLSSELTGEELQRKLEKYMKRLGVAYPEVYVQTMSGNVSRTVPESETVPLLIRRSA